MKIIFSSFGEFDRQHAIGPAQWPHFDLLFVHAGHVRLSIHDQVPIQLKRNQAVLLYPHTPFKGESISDTSLASVHHFLPTGADLARSSWPQNLFIGKQCGYDLLNANGNRQVGLDLDRSLRLPANLQPEAAQAMQCQLLELILSQLYCEFTTPPASKQSRDLSAVLDWLDHNLDKSISLAEMADYANLSASHFRRLFRQQVGESPSHYHHRLRIREACRLLTETALPIKTIAAQLGFEDLAHFYRGFSKEVGAPPAEYRRQYRPTG